MKRVLPPHENPGDHCVVAIFAQATLCAGLFMRQVQPNSDELTPAARLPADKLCYKKSIRRIA
jgi:hypothetical protein